MIPRTFEQWHHCITVECGIALTPAFLSERLTVWNDPDTDETRRFRRLYGDAHWAAVRGWFAQAAGLASGAPSAASH